MCVPLPLPIRPHLRLSISPRPHRPPQIPSRFPPVSQLIVELKLTWPQLFGNLVDHCFVSCVDDFSSKALSGRETGCISRCVQKSMATQQRLSERFQEENAKNAQQMQ